MKLISVAIIRCDGREEQHEFPEAGFFIEVDRLLGVTCTDSVNLRDGRRMIIDDNGYESKMIEHDDHHFELRPIKALKPVNAKATALYWSVCVPGTTHQIVGDVAIYVEKDFE